MSATVDVLIPTYNRPTALAVTLTSLCAQTQHDMHIVISDQSDNCDIAEVPEVQAILCVLASHGHRIDIYKHLPKLGIAENRQFLFEQACTEYSLFLDDDLILESRTIEILLKTIRNAGCGFVGSAVIGLSYINDIRPQEQHIEFWENAVIPETVRPNSFEWTRHRLHNAANIWHVQRRLGLSLHEPKLYKVAWIGGCVLYDVAKLLSVDGFNFWRQLPQAHCGEDVLAQLRVMAKYGGCGIIPSGVYHQELPTTIVDRSCDAPKVLNINNTMTARHGYA